MPLYRESEVKMIKNIVIVSLIVLVCAFGYLGVYEHNELVNTEEILNYERTNRRRDFSNDAPINVLDVLHKCNIKTTCIGKIGDLRASNEYNFAFDLDELDQIGNGAYSDNKKNSPYYVAIWLVNGSGEMSKPTIFKVNTNGERDCAKWTVSKVQ